MNRNKGLAIWQWSLVLALVLALVATARANTIECGAYFKLGVKADGTVVAWGCDEWDMINVPPGLNGVVAVASLGVHSLALKEDGTVVAWGNNWYGQCTVPPGLTEVVSVSGGAWHSVALKSDGTVVTWGRNWWGEGAVPADLGPVVAVEAGWGHNLAIKADGTVVAWGRNDYGECNVPAGLSGVVAVAGGNGTSLALKGNGTVVAWGSNIFGEREIPPGLTDVVAIAAGNSHNLALKGNGTVVAWGQNLEGCTDVPAGLSGVVAVAAGNANSMALKGNGTVVVWGTNFGGQLNVPEGVTFMLPNRPPQANAGENISILSKDQAATILPGIASDPNISDSLQYRWLEGETALTAWQPVQNGQAPLNLGNLPILTLGQHNLTLEVTDGKVTAKDTMVLTLGNSAPNPAPSGGGTYQVNINVSLGGQVSDFDGDYLTYKWLRGGVELTQGAVAGVAGGQPVNLTPFIVSSLPVGDYEFTLEVSDGINPAVSGSVTVSIIDDTAPTLAPTVDQTILWPPNKRMVPVTIRANGADNSGLPVTLAATVSCNEPLAGAPYWTEPVINQATGMITLQLKADRLGKGKGRMYTIGITATDQSGNVSTARVVVSVPHDQGKN